MWSISCTISYSLFKLGTNSIVSYKSCSCEFVYASINNTNYQYLQVTKSYN